jgi:hypothetical protein
MEGAEMFKFPMRKTFNSKRPNFRKVKLETTEEFLARGGKIKKIPLLTPLDILGKRAKRELSEE